MKTVIFVPETAPAPKVAQLLVYGAAVVMVKGTYDDAFELCLKASQEYGWYNRSTGINPFTREGKKTCAFEICEQLKWETPDKVFVPVGDGNIISGIWKGFVEFHRLGIIERLPQMVAVQAEHSDSVKRAFETGTDVQPVSGKTIADSISVSLPRDGLAAVMAIRDSQGFAVSVTDEEILQAIPRIARGSNVFAEPAASATYSGLLKAVREGKVKENESVVLLITGNGLKDVQSAMKSVGKPYVIKPELSELKKLVADQKLA
jgi:threonine synthase